MFANSLHYSKILILYIFSLVSINITCSAQETIETIPKQFPEILESISENIGSEVDISQITENLEYYEKNPIELNTATYQNFDQLGILTSIQIQSIINYRINKGPFISVFELKTIEGLSEQTINAIIPYVFINESNSQSILMPKCTDNQLITSISSTLQKLQGYDYSNDSIYKANPNKYFEGNPLNLRTKYRFGSNNKLFCGFTLEKDAGEALMKGTNTFFDFYSAYLEIKPNNTIQQVILGDFNANFGQGLVLWNGFALGKSAYTLTIQKPSEGFYHYSSTNENRYFRGIATYYKLGNYKLSLFYSYKYIDANTDSTKNLLEVSSLQENGLHRLQSEIIDKDALLEKSYGGNLSFEKGKLKIGASFLQSNYSLPFVKSAKPYQAFDFHGKRVTTEGLNFKYRLRYCEVFGESAYSSNGGFASLLGTLVQLNSNMSLSVLYRNFTAGYFSPYANGFRQGSSTSNEDGLYTGLEMKITPQWNILSYIDIYKFPWLKYNISKPSNGLSYLLESRFQLSKSNNLILKYTRNNDEIDQASASGNYLITLDRSIQRCRLQINYKPSENTELRNRFEWCYYSIEKGNSDNGFLLNQDIIWNSQLLKLNIIGRYEVFQTSSWNSRIYTYENDFLYSYSVPALEGKGIRTYIVAKYKGFRKLQISIRYSLTIYSDKTTIGSSASLINGNKKSDIGLQTILRF